MSKIINVMNDAEALEVLFLQMHAYRMERQALGLDEGEPLPDSIGALRTSGETFIGLTREGRLAAAISYLRTDAEVVVRRLMVHPDYVRRGFATKLLQELEQRETDLVRLSVTAGEGNTPAMALYRSCGYCECGRQRHPSGIMLATFEKFLSG